MLLRSDKAGRFHYRLCPVDANRNAEWMEERKGRAETLEKGPFRACKCLSEVVSTSSYARFHFELLTQRALAATLRTLSAGCRDIGVRSPPVLR